MRVPRSIFASSPTIRLLAGCLTCVIFAGLQMYASETGGRTIRVVAPSDYYPYSHVDSTGRLTGFSTELLDAVARIMDLHLQREVKTTAEVLADMKEGKADLAQLHSIIEGGDPELLSSSSFLVLQGVLFVREGDRRFASLEDVKRQRAKLASGRVGLRYALAQGVDASLLQQAPTDEALRQLSRGQVDAALVTRLTGQAQSRRLGFSNVVPTGYPLKGYTVRFCFAARSNDADLIAQLNDGIEVLRRSGEFDAIYAKWFSEYEPPRFTMTQVTTYVVGALAIALSVAVWALLRGRALNARIALQTEELAESHSILAEAQHFARLGHWRHSRDDEAMGAWSEETYHILERDRRCGPMNRVELVSSVAEGDRIRFGKAIAQLDDHFRAFEMDVIFLTRSGLRKTLHWRGRPVYDPTGRPSGSFGTVQDITERRGAEQALLQSERLLRVLYETLPLGLGVVDWVDGRWVVTALNPEAIRQMGLASAESIGRPLAKLGLADEDLIFWSNVLRQSLDFAEPLRLERGHDHGRRTQAVTVISVGASGQPARVCMFMEDVTDRRHKDAEIELGRRMRAIGELVGGIAHEFNNLLTPILLSVERMQADAIKHPRMREELAIVLDATQRSAELTKRLLTFGRKSDRELIEISLHEIVTGNVELLRHAFDRRISFDYAQLKGLPELNVCMSDLNQVFMNLFLNARDTLAQKLSQRGSQNWTPKIVISGEKFPSEAFEPIDAATAGDRQGWVRVSVRDNGCGMSKEVAERVFEPFFTTKPVGKGTGLGLATVWHLVSEMGGRLDVDSTFGEGTAFHICLPLRKASAHTVERAEENGAGLIIPGGLRLLIVEDEPQIAELISLLLEADGHEVTRAANGRAGWDLLSAAPQRFSGVVMDLNMPEMSGLELARRARALPFSKPIIVMSGRVSEEEHADLQSLGITMILNKPFDSQALRKAMLVTFGVPQSPGEPLADLAQKY